jgi:hypothetical protein
MHKVRPLKNAKIEHVPINENDQYNFSSSYSLSVYSIEAVYSFIPKNACSTLRYSIAVANGFINEIADVEWIHANNETFIATQKDIAQAKYTFVVLRCPFRRVASAFLDQILEGESTFKDLNEQKLSINFHEFLLIIQSQSRNERDQHWKNQSDFLHYEKYDDYFSLELFSKAISSLEHRGLKVHDTRKIIKHDISSLKSIDGDFSKTKEIDLKKIKDDGYAPSYESLYGNSEIELVKDIYKDDIELYIEHFGEENLLFSSNNI